MGEQEIEKNDRMEKYCRDFSYVDTNRNGKLTVKELQKAAMCQGYNPTKEEIRDHFITQMDSNEDGQISFAEYCNYMEYCYHERPNPSDELREAFAYYAKSRNGRIGKEDLRRLLKENGEFDAQDVDEVMEQFDTNDDGELDYEEFVQMVTQTAH